MPIISQAPASDKQRQQWLERLWDALQNDQMPYIEYLGDFWGELCATPAIASSWVDRFIDLIRHIWSIRIPGQFHFFSGITPCLSALYAAKRYDELLDLLKGAPSKYWRHRHWGVKALLALEKPEEALKYIDDSKGLNAPTIRMACESEAILLSMGLADEAYERYAFEANMKPTHLATFRALTKKYPNKEPLHILQDLIDSQPGNEGKWFAAAKDAGFYDLAVKLVLEHPADPRTLARATKEFSEKNPPFAIACGMAGLRWIIEGYGYEISGSDVYEAYYGILQAAKALGLPPEAIKKDILALFIQEKPCTRFVKNILQRDLGE